MIRYLLLNGCVSILVPVKPGAPLVAWDGLTLEQLWEIDLPPDSVDEGGKPSKSASGKFEGVVQVLYEYLDLCVDWDRLVLPQDVLQVVNPEIGDSGTTDTIISTPDDAGSDVVKADDGTEEVQLPAYSDGGVSKLDQKHEALRGAVTLLVASAIRSKDSKAARKEIDVDRAGIAMWRIR